MDIFFQFNTTYYDSDGEEIFSKVMIRKNYIFGQFLIDLLSSFPVEYIFKQKVFRLLNVLKILRIFRISGIINKMNVDEETKSVSLFLLFNIFTVAQNVQTHFLSCAHDASDSQCLELHLLG